jgi:hypothetical protein
MSFNINERKEYPLDFLKKKKKKVKNRRVLVGQATINVVLSNVEAFVFQGGNKINLIKNIKAERRRRKPEAKGVPVRKD